MSVTGVHCFLPLVAPSLSRIYEVDRTKCELVTLPAVQEFRKQVKAFLPAWAPQPDTLYTVSFDFLEDWFYANGKLKRKDAPNLLKSCLDAVMERYQLDDCYILSATARKVQETSKVGLVLRLQRVGTVEDFRLGRLS